MALPKVKQAIHKHVLTGLKKEIMFRAFTNAEQKILLVAKESKDKEEIIDAVTQVLNNCIISDVDIDSLAIFDIEDLFLRIRAKSVGEIISTRYRYDFDKDGKKESQFIDININIDEIKVEVSEDHKDIIELDDVLSIQLKHPTYNIMKETEKLSANEKDVAIILKCIDTVFDAEEIYNLDEYTDEEQQEFYDGLTVSTMLEIKKFFDTMPTIKHQIEVETVDGTKNIKFRGIEDFFI